MSNKTKLKTITPPPYKQKSTLIDNNKLNKEYSSAIKKPDTLKFSFKYLDFTDKQFQIDKCETAWFKKLFERKKHYCTMYTTDIKCSGDPTRCHPINWEKTSRKRGFNLSGLSPDVEPYQLSVSQKKGRIVGFFIDDVFNVVWFDPDHNLYP